MVSAMTSGLKVVLPKAAVAKSAGGANFNKRKLPFNSSVPKKQARPMNGKPVNFSFKKKDGFNFKLKSGTFKGNQFNQFNHGNRGFKPPGQNQGSK